MDSDRHQRALEAFRRHAGKEHAEIPSMPNVPASADLARMLFEGTYGDIWSRPGLDMRTRSFISMTINAALGTEAPFKQHVRLAENVGITRDEIVEMLIQFNGYLGTPRAFTAMKLVWEVWEESSKASGK